MVIQSDAVIKPKIFMFTWIILPILILMITTNYLIGISRNTMWQTTNNTVKTSAVTLNNAVQLPENVPLHWHHSGLVTLWLDDAWLSQFMVAYPMVSEKKFTAAVAVPTAFVGYDDYMSWNQLKLLQYRGWEITSHTRNHTCDPNQITDAYLEEELSGSLSDLKSQGFQPLNFVSPCGTITPKMIELTKKYYISLRTTITGFNPLPVTDPYQLKVQEILVTTTPDEVQRWVDEAKTTNSWLILMFHQIGNGNEKFSTTPEHFEQFLNIIQQASLPVVTPTQAMQLIIDTPPSPPSTISEVMTTASSSAALSAFKVEILSNNLGYLRVREKPSQNSLEIGKVFPSEVYDVSEELDGWYQVIINASESGWISKKYVKKI